MADTPADCNRTAATAAANPALAFLLGLGQSSGDGTAKAGFFGDIKVHGVPVWLKTDVECEFKIEFKIEFKSEFKGGWRAN
ncbi:MAG: hypothetical protein MH219_09535 [Marinobacter sp.]|nr:hypothetical protein [Marinobacter sp.]